VKGKTGKKEGTGKGKKKREEEGRLEHLPAMRRITVFTP